MIDKLSKIIMLIIITYSLSGQEGTTYEAGKLLIKVSTPFSYIDNSGAVTTTEKQWFNTLATYYEIHKLKPIFSNSEGDMDLYYYIEFDYLYTVNQVKYSFFKPQGVFAFQPIPVKWIERLELKDGRVAVLDGKVNSLTLEEYQKLSTKEKAIYDAKSKNLVKWALYGPTSIIIFMGSTFLHQGLMGGEFWESPIFLAGSSAASLTIPYLFFNREEKFNFPKSILTDSEKEIYEQAYFKKLQKRRYNVVVGSCVFIGVIVALAAASFSLDFSSDDFGYITDGYNP